MTIQPILIGNYANDGTGDDLRTAFTKVNANFATLTTSISISDGTSLGTGAAIFKDKNTANLEFRSLTSTDSTVTFTTNPLTIDLKAVTRVNLDTAPSLGANLSLNGYNITGSGDVRSTVWGLDARLLNSLIGVIIEKGLIKVDLGSFIEPTGRENRVGGFSLDFGSFTSPITNIVNFGTIA
jgi:hypothetical protein